MARKRIYHTMRIESIEAAIAFFEAQGNYEAAEGIRYLAGNVCDETNIETERASYREFFERIEREREAVPDV